MVRKWLVLLPAFVILAAGLGMGTSTARAQSSYVNYIVQPGDTLGKIALQYCTTWNEIYDLNRDTIGKNPNVISAGMVLHVPSYCGSAAQLPEGIVVDKGPMTRATGLYIAPYYTVAWGDTLFSVGQRFGLDWNLIARANGIQGNLIYAGQALLISSEPTSPSPNQQGPAERVYFQSGAYAASRSGLINQGVAKSYILWARAGQTMAVNTVSHGEPLVISIGNTRGDLLPVTGVNSQINNSVSVVLPESGDFIVTVRPTTGPENPQLAFDVTFTIR